MLDQWLDEPGCRAELEASSLNPKTIPEQTAQWIGQSQALAEIVFTGFLNAVIVR